MGQVAELEYACGLGPHPERVEGSNPSLPTLFGKPKTALRRFCDLYIFY